MTIAKQTVTFHFRRWGRKPHRKVCKLIDWPKTIVYWVIALSLAGFLFFFIKWISQHGQRKWIPKGFILIGWIAGFFLLLLAPSLSQLLFRLQRNIPWWQFNRTALSADPMYFLGVILAALFFYFWWLIRLGKREQLSLLGQAQSILPERKPDPKVNPKLKFILVAIVLLLLCAFSIFIWPTPYQYSKVYIGNWEFTKRTIRFTGKSQIRIIKALVPALQKWQYDKYGASVEIPEVENLAQKYIDQRKREWIEDSVKLEKEMEQWNTQFANRETTITIVDLDKLVTETKKEVIPGLDIVRGTKPRKRTGPKITWEEILGKDGEDEPATKTITMIYKEFCRRELKERYNWKVYRSTSSHQMALDDFAAQPGWTWLEWY